MDQTKVDRFKIGGFFTFRAYDVDGKTLLWEEKIEAKNLVPTAGLTSVLSVYFNSGTQITTWYMGLINNSGFATIAAGDTSASHAGWSESTDYGEAVRQTIAFAAASAGAIASSASCSFTMNATVTIKGAFVISNSTKGGTTGTLFAAASFTNTQAMTSGQVLKVDYSCSATSS